MNFFKQFHSKGSVPTHDRFEETSKTATQLRFYSDASANAKLRFGAIFDQRWLFVQWEDNFIQGMKPSIEYLELVGMVAALLTRGHYLKNQRVIFVITMRWSE